MKKFIYTAAFALISIGSLQAQEKIQEIETTRTTVKSSLGNETVTKKVKTTKVTPTYLNPAQAGMENQSLQRGETMIRKEVTYTYDDSDFKLEETKNGYKIIRTRENNSSEYGTMRKLSRSDVYMMRTADGISIVYFDTNGNMISEKYNDEDDTMTITTFTVQPKVMEVKM